VTESQTEMQVVEEEIFAIAYSLVKVSYGFGKGAVNYIKKISVFGLPKRANAKHFALGKDDEKKEDEDVELDGNLFLDRH
jgi:hypothetical protein